ncbi:hypothetical protein YPPY66_4577 [Yersinia pestis PY-66]|uniref:Uncharacterized protein n=2 Tax=Yersinia pestis TaxID=632 RepID=A0AAV3B6R3_YERPE|nr:hypothetical protein YPIP275_3878 [Yersinia pestis biovar Orientalis str. IP275]EDR57577.1 hypothetical protein YpMG051020_4002 [Yersinia pestis biovar Orientalis str. MG05-1020]EDR63941.1 hypothetical protein YpK1973002_3513 [Yersinia pestis biovar Mediaevalis str. K1973002]EEO85808.1 hypothetical protein YPH_1677 [Yersinia pestis biovar Orientalis str. PEXU2]EIQ84395.1 hypothetical protein YPPY02_4224 [Yersinia pestis PY-02]EIQ97490.1 hypothetical protein YPPY04_4231 [Yersinia pestis PY-0
MLFSILCLRVRGINVSVRDEGRVSSECPMISGIFLRFNYFLSVLTGLPDQ